MLTWLTVVSCGLQLVPGRLEPTSIIFRKSSEEGAVRRAGSFLKTNNMLHCIWKLDIFTPDLFLARPFSHFGHKAWQIGTRGKSPPQQEGDGDLSCWTCIRTDMVWVINVGDKFLLFFLTGEVIVFKSSGKSSRLRPDLIRHTQIRSSDPLSTFKCSILLRN